MFLVTLILGVFIAELRIFGETAPWFQALAHFYLGYVFTYYFTRKPKDDAYLAIALFLTALELAMFILTKG